VRRAAKVAGVAANQGARNYATKAANLTRDEDGRRAAAEKRQIAAAEQIVDVLGQMKGAAMKVGQVMSFMDTGALPPDVQERFQTKLAALRDSAPKVSFEDMRKVVEADLEEPLEDVFDEFEPEALAAASIGQVYPTVAQAVRADMQNLGLILRAAKTMAPGMDSKAMAGEIRERIYEELDYEHEAQAQRQMARLWRGHPFVVIPDVVTRLSRERVLVTEWIDGERVAFLDFGMTRHVPRGHVEDKIALFRAGLDRDAQRYHDCAVQIGFFPDAEVQPQQALDHFCAVTEWWREDRVFTIDQPYIRRVMIDLGDPRSEHWGIMRKSTIPAEALLAGRTETLTLGVLGQLEASANWHRIMLEYIADGAPATPLGEQDAAFWRERPARRAA
jgi:predicted unusual protein kinase regulating ubiquinone biosynthesis (AarF/ABC1/UbiB family)